MLCPLYNSFLSLELVEKCRYLFGNKSYDTALEEQDSDTEYSSDDVLPYLYHASRTEVVLAEIDEESADNCAYYSTSAADGDPDYHCDRIGYRHLRRSYASVEVYENSSCNAGNNSRKDIYKVLVRGYLIA